MELKVIKGISLGLSVVGAVVSLAADIMGKKEMDAKIAKTVAEELLKYK